MTTVYVLTDYGVGVFSMHGMLSKIVFIIRQSKRISTSLCKLTDW